LQKVHRVPPVFFLEVKRHWNTPFWRHDHLKAICADEEGIIEPVDNSLGDELDDGADSEGDDDYDDNIIEMEEREGGMTFEEAIKDEIAAIWEFANRLQHQIQFHDQRMLRQLQWEGAGFLRLAQACLHNEKRMRWVGGRMPAMWEKSTLNTMYYCARPTPADQNFLNVSMVCSIFLPNRSHHCSKSTALDFLGPFDVFGIHTTTTKQSSYLQKEFTPVLYLWIINAKYNQ
jgi:hypothetical protein